MTFCGLPLSDLVLDTGNGTNCSPWCYTQCTVDSPSCQKSCLELSCTVKKCNFSACFSASLLETLLLKVAIPPRKT